MPTGLPPIPIGTVLFRGSYIPLFRQTSFDRYLPLDSAAYEPIPLSRVEITHRLQGGYTVWRHLLTNEVFAVKENEKMETSNWRRVQEVLDIKGVSGKMQEEIRRAYILAEAVLPEMIAKLGNISPELAWDLLLYGTCGAVRGEDGNIRRVSPDKIVHQT